MNSGPVFVKSSRIWTNPGEKAGKSCRFAVKIIAKPVDLDRMPAAAPIHSKAENGCNSMGIMV